MRETNRSLWVAILACLAMGFYAKSPKFPGETTWITAVFFFATLAVSAWGFWLGLRGARRLRTFWAWLAPVMNAMVFVSLLAFYFLMLWRLKNL
jgi:hypothetical protein